MSVHKNSSAKRGCAPGGNSRQALEARIPLRWFDVANPPLFYRPNPTVVIDHFELALHPVQALRSVNTRFDIAVVQKHAAPPMSVNDHGPAALAARQIHASTQAWQLLDILSASQAVCKSPGIAQSRQTRATLGS